MNAAPKLWLKLKILLILKSKRLTGDIARSRVSADVMSRENTPAAIMGQANTPMDATDRLGHPAAKLLGVQFFRLVNFGRN